MTEEKFNVIVDEWLIRIKGGLKSKGGEYSGKEDRLLNFKQAAKLQQCTPEQALLGFVTKHIVSVYDTIDRGCCRDERYWTEKLGDIINYCILLSALLEERKELVD